jgi:hypothetical protein
MTFRLILLIALFPTVSIATLIWSAWRKKK